MARSPHRIKPFLASIEAVWSLPMYADERFGQFVMNLTRDENGAFQDAWEWETSRWRKALERRWEEAYRQSPSPDTGGSAAAKNSTSGLTIEQGGEAA